MKRQLGYGPISRSLQPENDAGREVQEARLCCAAWISILRPERLISTWLRSTVGLGSRTSLSRATSRFSAYDADAKECEPFCDRYFF